MESPPLHRRASPRAPAREHTRPFDSLAPPGAGWLPLAIAALGAACLVWSAGEAPLPALPWAAAFLFAAVFEDVRTRRIPNWLTLPSLILALGLAALGGGLAGLEASLLGAGAGLGVLFVPFVLRWVGAGDVKAAMVLGALFGVNVLLPALWWMIVIGGLMAIAWVLARGGVRDMARRWRSSFELSLATGRPTYLPPEPGSAAAGGIPFAVAMVLGPTAYQLWGLPWM